MRLCLADIRVTVVLLVPRRIVIHSLFQRSSDAHIVNNQAAFLILENAVEDVYKRQRLTIKRSTVTPSG